MSINYNNTFVIALADNPIFHSRTKHVDIDCHFIQEHILSKEVIIYHIALAYQLVDVITKLYQLGTL